MLSSPQKDSGDARDPAAVDSYDIENESVLGAMAHEDAGKEVYIPVGGRGKLTGPEQEGLKRRQQKRGGGRRLGGPSFAVQILLRPVNVGPNRCSSSSSVIDVPFYLSLPQHPISYPTIPIPTWMLPTPTIICYL